jgi:hypothetical protein
MSVDAGSVYSSIRVRLADLDNDLKGVYARLNQLEGKITTSNAKSASSFKTMFGAVVTGQAVIGLAQRGFSALTGAIKDSIQVSVDAQEVISKYDVVFGGMGDASELAAKRFSDSFDLAGATAKEMLSNTGNLLQGMGATKDESLALSIEVNTLASDLASFTNNQGGSKAASEALTKALLGEKESMKTLGIAILDSDVNARVAKNGQSELTGTALKLAKAQATLQLITEQSKNAIGDYARTQDSAANVQKRAAESTKELQIAIGTALNPAITLAASLWSRVSGALTEVITKQNVLRDAEKAEGTENDTLDKQILRLQEEGKVLEANVSIYKVYDEEGKLVRTRALEDAEKELAANEAQIKSLQIRIQYEKQADDQKRQAIATITELGVESEAEATAEAERAQEIADQKKAINDEFLAQTEEINWKVEEGLETELEGREDMISAAEKQIQSLYALYKLTGDQSILTGEQMDEAIAKLEKFSEKTVDAKVEVADFANVGKAGVSSLSSSLVELGEEIGKEDAEWSDLGAASLGVIADMLKALGDELIVQSGINTVLGLMSKLSWFGAAAAAIIGAAAAYTASGVVQNIAGSYETGGIVPGNSYSGDNVLIAANSGEEVVTASDKKRITDYMTNNGSANTTFILEVDGQQLSKIVLNPVNNGTTRLKL